MVKLFLSYLTLVPLLSDPGLILVKECIKQNLKIFSNSGVSSITTAMSVSGFDDKYLFMVSFQKK